jgi:hypothetical protein
MIENFFPDNASVSSSTPVSAPLAPPHADSSIADDGFVLVSHPGRQSPPPPAQPAMPPPPPPQPSVAPPPPPLPKRPNHSSAASDSQPQPFATPIAQGSARNLVFSPDTLAAVQSIPYIAVETDDSPLSGAVRCKVTYTPMRAAEPERRAVGGDSDGGALITPSSSSSGAADSHLSADSGALFSTPVAPPRVHALASALNAASSSAVAAARGSGVAQSPFGGTPLASPAARAAVRNLIANRAAAVGASNKKPPQPNRPPPPPPPM